MTSLSAQLRGAAILTLTMVVSLATTIATPARAQEVRLKGHTAALAPESTFRGRVDASENVEFALTLPLRNVAELDTLLARLYDPNDTLHGQFLTPEQFTARFGPTAKDYAKLKAYAVSKGFSIKAETPGRTMLTLSAPASVVQAAFKVGLNQYTSADGRRFIRPDAEPAVDLSVAPLVNAVVGLDTSAVATPRSHIVPGYENIDANAQPRVGAGGTGPGLTFAPKDISAAYNVPYSLSNGAGQTVALFQLDGFLASDISAYEKQWGLPNVPIEIVLVNGATGGILSAGGQEEVTLDLEMVLAMAPGVTKIIDYCTTQGTVGILAGYQQIATENRARQVSTSWGNAEPNLSASYMASENNIFKQMAAQGQSMFGPAGDAGSNDNHSSLSVDDPGAQPFVTCCGGTHLSTNGPGGSYKSETVWNDLATINPGATGGGISTVWPIPSWQTAAAAGNAQASKSMRNVPDVALNADTLSPYAVYVSPPGLTPGWYGIGGTSAAAPSWAAFTAIANQKRAALGLSSIGFLNPILYAIASTPRYATDFQDVVSGNNPAYNAVSGYDLATGLGSFNGVNLFTDLVAFTSAPTLSSILPTTVAANTAFTLTVNGSNFTSNSKINVGAVTVPTTFVSATQLTSAIPATLLTVAGTSAVSVTTPAPGGGTSSSANLTVTAISPVIAHVLLKSVGGSEAVWSVKKDGTFASTAAFGPFGSWQAQFIADGPDGLPRILWVDGTGAFSVWVTQPNGSYVSSQGFGPFTGWSPQGISVGGDGLSRILLQNTNGSIAVWTLDSSLNFLSSTAALGPFGGWAGKAISVGPDNLIRVLFVNGSQSSVWTLNAAGAFGSSTAAFGPITGWAASSIAVGSDNLTRLIWNGSGSTAIWTLNAGGAFSTSSPAEGPFGAWTAISHAVGSDNFSRLLLSNGSQFAVWLFSGVSTFSSSPSFGPISGWSAKAVAAP